MKMKNSISLCFLILPLCFLDILTCIFLGQKQIEKWQYKVIKIGKEKGKDTVLHVCGTSSPWRGITGRLLSPWLHLETNIWTTLSFLYWHKLNEPQKLRSRWMTFWQLFVEFDRELWNERASGWFAASCVLPRSPEHHKLRPSIFYYQRNSIKPLTSRNIIHLPSEFWPLSPMSLTLM